MKAELRSDESCMWKEWVKDSIMWWLCDAVCCAKFSDIRSSDFHISWVMKCLFHMQDFKILSLLKAITCSKNNSSSHSFARKMALRIKCMNSIFFNSLNSNCAGSVTQPSLLCAQLNLRFQIENISQHSLNKWFCLPVSSIDVYPDHNPDHLCKPQCVSLPGNALHAEGLRGSLPSRAERTQAQAQPEGCGHCSHHV